jgi:hypothetical protein
MLSVTDIILEQHGNLMRQGAILVDPTDEGDDPSIIFLLTHEIKSGDDKVISKRLQFVRVAQDGAASFAGWAPHLDLEKLDPADLPLLKDVLNADWIRGDQEQKALALAAGKLVPEHYREVADRRIAHVDKTLAAVNERLNAEIKFWTDRWEKLKEDERSGKDVRLNLEKYRRTVTDLEGRLENRKRELQAMRHIISATPVALGGALVVPRGLLRKLRGESATDDDLFCADPVARARIERLAMDAVRRREESKGCQVRDVSAEKCGWDISSYPPAVNGIIPEARHIEVKGRIKGAATVTLTSSEVRYAVNQADKFVLAIVLVGTNDEVDGPYYVRRSFREELELDVAAVSLKIEKLLMIAEDF